MELGQYDEAQAEFEHVLLAAPDNLIAVRSMAELHQRRSDAPPVPEASPTLPETALPPPEPEALAFPPEQLMNFDDAVAEFNTVFGVPPPDPVLVDLEGWLAAIQADRVERSA